MVAALTNNSPAFLLNVGRYPTKRRFKIKISRIWNVRGKQKM